MFHHTINNISVNQTTGKVIKPKPVVPKVPEFKPSFEKISETIKQTTPCTPKGFPFSSETSAKKQTFNLLTQVVVPVLMQTPNGPKLTQQVGYVPHSSIIFPNQTGGASMQMEEMAQNLMSK